MKMHACYRFIAVLTLFFLLAGAAAGQESPPAEAEAGASAQEQSAPETAAEGEPADETPAGRGFQVALFSPYQIHKPETSIRGFRWNILYGVNQNVAGLDMGAINVVKGDFSGIQVGFYNEVLQKADGAQAGILNTAGETSALQVGIINHAATMGGIQIGLLYNTADTMKGVQVGLLNFSWDRKPIFFFPIVNAAF